MVLLGLCWCTIGFVFADVLLAPLRDRGHVELDQADMGLVLACTAAMLGALASAA